MSKPEQTKVAIIGGGVIGFGWAKVFSRAGWKTALYDTDPRTKERIAASFPDGTVEFISDLATAVKDADFVQENTPERLEIKKDIFTQLAQHAPSHAVLASSSSSIVSSKFSEGNPAADRILIGHPFNPVDVMPLVEVVPHVGTSKETIKKAVDVYQGLGQEPIVLHKEIGGFVGNRLQKALNDEAMYLVQQDVISAGDLDRLMLVSLGLRWATVGPFEGLHLGGGPEGISHMFANVGKGLDITLGTVDRSPEAIGKIVRQVNEVYGVGVDSWTEHSKARDELAEGILKLRKSA